MWHVYGIDGELIAEYSQDSSYLTQTEYDYRNSQLAEGSNTQDEGGVVMAIVISDKSKCALCGEVLEEGQEVISLSPFIGNELDPLWVFSDAAFHAVCFHSDPRSEEVQRRYDELRRHTAPGNRVCIVCKKEINNPDDYFTVGHLLEQASHPLYRHNYVQAHRSCLPRWSELSHVFELIDNLKKSGAWQGPTLDRLLGDLETARRIAV